MADRLEELKQNYFDCDFDYKDIEWLFSKIEEQAAEIDRLENVLEEVTEDRNKWRSNSLDWEGYE
ncbi:hypothetical protein [Bacillus infantis]|uniref:hypothetical protein n=1 Tax=Bacillus infantis TaxID=324767 RepID=UPI003CED5E33